MNKLLNLNPTERALLLSQAKKVRAEQLRIWSELVLKQDFADCDFTAWRELASAAGFRLPVRTEPCTTKRMAQFLRRMGVSHDRYKAEAGHSLADFVALNPYWPLYAWVGTTLELVC